MTGLTRREFAGMATAATAMSGGAFAAMDKVKAGFVYAGPVRDHGWTYQHNEGRVAVEAALGDKVETTFFENVPEGADAERVITRMATSGHDLIFTTSFGYMNPTLKVAKRFPNVMFEHATGFKRADNVSTYSARFYEGRHVAGLMSGKMTKTKKLGYVASFPIPEVIRGINAVTMAARSIDPEITMRVIWVSSWFDPGKEAEAARALADQGVDVLFQHTNSSAPNQVAEERGIKTVGQASDMARFAPNAHMVSIINDWAPYYVSRMKAVLDGSWASEDIFGGFDTGMIKMGVMNANLPSEVKAMALAAEQAIKTGALHPFIGPIIKQDGTVVGENGGVLDIGDILGQNFYVKGVEGQIPG